MDYSGMNNSRSADFLSFNESPGNRSRRDRNNQYSGDGQPAGFSSSLQRSFSPFNRGRNRSRQKRSRRRKTPTNRIEQAAPPPPDWYKDKSRETVVEKFNVRNEPRNRGDQNTKRRSRSWEHYQEEQREIKTEKRRKENSYDRNKYRHREEEPVNNRSGGRENYNRNDNTVKQTEKNDYRSESKNRREDSSFKRVSRSMEKRNHRDEMPQHREVKHYVKPESRDKIEEEVYKRWSRSREKCLDRDETKIQRRVSSGPRSESRNRREGDFFGRRLSRDRWEEGNRQIQIVNRDILKDEREPHRWAGDNRGETGHEIQREVWNENVPWDKIRDQRNLDEGWNRSIENYEQMLKSKEIEFQPHNRMEKLSWDEPEQLNRRRDVNIKHENGRDRHQIESNPGMWTDRESRGKSRENSYARNELHRDKQFISREYELPGGSGHIDVNNVMYGNREVHLDEFGKHRKVREGSNHFQSQHMEKVEYFNKTTNIRMERRSMGSLPQNEDFNTAPIIHPTLSSSQKRKPKKTKLPNSHETGHLEYNDHKYPQPGPRDVYKEPISSHMQESDQQVVNSTPDHHPLDLLRNIDRLYVAIVDLSNIRGLITEEESKMIKNALMRMLDEVLFNRTVVSPPTFKSWFYEFGVLKVRCEDESTLKWLTSAVTSLPQLWHGRAQLNLVQADLFFRLTKAVLFIPDEIGDVPMIKSRIASQNPWATVDDWIIYHHHCNQLGNEKKQMGSLCVFGIPIMDVIRLNEKERKIHYGFTKLFMKIPPSADQLLDTAFQANTMYGTRAKTGH